MRWTCLYELAWKYFYYVLLGGKVVPKWMIRTICVFFKKCVCVVYILACICGENYEMVHKLVTVAPGYGAQRLAGRLIFHYISFFKLIFYCSINALQCYVSFCCTMKWISHMHTYILSFLDFPPHHIYPGHYREPS